MKSIKEIITKSSSINESFDEKMFKEIFKEFLSDLKRYMNYVPTYSGSAEVEYCNKDLRESARKLLKTNERNDILKNSLTDKDYKIIGKTIIDGLLQNENWLYKD